MRYLIQRIIAWLLILLGAGAIAYAANMFLNPGEFGKMMLADPMGQYGKIYYGAVLACFVAGVLHVALGLILNITVNIARDVHALRTPRA